MLQQGLYKGKDGEAVRLYVEPEQNNFASEKHGRPIFDEVLYAEVTAPGQKESSPVFVLERKYADEVGIEQPQRTEKYTQYKELIDAYRSGNDSVDVRGTPLAAWPAMTVALVATCHHAGVYTVEALSALPDSRLSALGPGARSLVERAKAFVSAAEGNAPGEALAAENAQLREDMANLQKQVADLSSRLGASQEGKSAALQTVADEKAVQPPPPPPPPAKKGGGNSII
jgi:hypothetical protein